jgi:hypothetical protein
MARVRINAVIDEGRKLRLFHALLDDRISFTEWLRRQIDGYLAEKEPKARMKRKLGKGA